MVRKPDEPRYPSSPPDCCWFLVRLTGARTSEPGQHLVRISARTSSNHLLLSCLGQAMTARRDPDALTRALIIMAREANAHTVAHAALAADQAMLYG